MWDDERYKIGYKRPPIAAQFKKGKSGNPSGRPKKKEEGIDDLLRKAVNSKIRVTTGNKTAELKKIEVIILRVVQDALNGNLPSAKFVLKHCTESGIQKSLQEELVYRMKGARESLRIKLDELALRAQQRNQQSKE